MNTEKLTVPLNEDGKFVLDFSRDSSKKRRSRKIHIFTGVTYLVIVNVSLLVVTILTFSRLRNLENEVDFLKDSINDMKLRDESLVNTIMGFENDDFYEEDSEGERQRDPEVFMGFTDDDTGRADYDYYDQLISNDTEELDQEQNNGIRENRMATNLTKEGKETSRRKRNVVAATQDGIVINSESYAERKARNNTRSKQYRLRGFSITPVSARPSSFGSSPWDSSQDHSSEDSTSVYKASHNIDTSRRTSSPIYTRRSRVMHREDKSKAFRQVVKKSSLKSGDTFSEEEEETTSAPDFTIVREVSLGRRRYRERHLPLENLDESRARMGRAKLPAIHYSGDTSRYVVGRHTNFNGNGHLRHPDRTFVDWKVSDWAISTGMDAYFTMDEGILKIKESGIYFIYAQIYYLDEHDTTGFRVYKNSKEIILQCTITIHARERGLIGNTCYTAGVEYLSEGDTISLADVTNGRYSLFEPGKSFFGLIKLSDMKIK